MRKFCYTMAIWFLVISVLSGQEKRHEEEREIYNAYFDQAGEEFGVPSDLLRALSFAETRWTHMKWDDDDTLSSCSGMPRVYGVMGLWDNEYFGYSLREAANLIGKTHQELKESPLQNIRGAAALLKKYYDELSKPENVNAGAIESWQNAIAKFSGFPQEEIAQRRGLEVYAVLSTGYERDRITIRKQNIDLETIQRIVDKTAKTAAAKNQNKQLNKTANQPDYPLAKWNAAYSGNFGTQLIQQKFVVVHDVEGSYLGCISWFKNPAAQVSAHYVLNSHPNSPVSKQPTGSPDAPVGEVTQMVEEKFRAWHVGCWNSYMVGIEHEGYYNVSGWYTQECYESSSRLVAYLCDKYGIPKDRNHVIAHSEHQNSAWRNWVTSTGQGFDPTCNTHVDPGQYWDWTKFMNLVTVGDTVKPQILTATPAGGKPVPTYKEITVQFNTPMDAASTAAAFSIIPAVTGTKSWNNDNTVLTFDPSSNLAWNTLYTVTVDSSAKNVSLKKSLGGIPYSFSFTTEPIDTAGPTVLWTYPYDNAIDVPVKPEVILVMDDGVLTPSLSATLKFTDENNVNVSMSGAKNEVIDDLGYISFMPALKPNRTYRIKLLPGIKDYYNNSSKDTVLIQFKTEAQEFISTGIPIDLFESNGRGWMQPAASQVSQNIDTAMTKFGFVPEKRYSGTNSGKLTYKFLNSTGGVIDLKTSSMPEIDSYMSIGLWVYGDIGNNALKLIFSPDNQSFDFGPIHWRGWKYISLPVAQITGTNRKLSSVQILQRPGGAVEGVLYFDDLQVNAATTVVPSREVLSPAAFVLEQNFPNPFNPSTTFQFSSPAAGIITLEVFDVLGRRIRTLLNEYKESGLHRIAVDFSELPSGVYYYTLRAGDFVSSKKMVLLK
ncbi:MAG: Ig-like domain-containing protein [Bacteroidota bacterium]